MARNKNFYKVFLLLATFSFFSCANEKNIEVYTFPEFQVKAGSTRSFDLSNYLSIKSFDPVGVVVVTSTSE